MRTCLVVVAAASSLLISSQSIAQTPGLPLTKQYIPVAPAVDAPVSANRVKALGLYKRLAGVTTSIDSPQIMKMEEFIAAGDWRAAAQVATSESSFYNFVVRDMAAKMSTREESVTTRLNDFIATFVGVTRDNTDARELLTADMFYAGAATVPVTRDVLNDVVMSNRHYEALESGSYNLPAVLTRINSQYLRRSDNTVVAHPDAAGLLTTRAFMEAHAIAGTNRRLVEYTVREFTCNSIQNWADATSPDIRVGRDIDRFPGGESAKYQTSCKACHANMDGFRGAFGRYDFANNFVKYSAFYPNGGGTGAMEQAPIGIARKLNHNETVFPQGHVTLDDSWVNFARSPANEILFGWRGNASGGTGVKQFGAAIANSKAFSNCMVKRVFVEVCRREPAAFEVNKIQQLATQFETSGYKLKDLFEVVAIQPECVGR